MKLLIVNWEDPGVLKVLEAASDDNIPQEILQGINNNEIDVFKAEAGPTGIEYRRLLVSELEAADEDEDNEPELEAARWEIVSDPYAPV